MKNISSQFLVVGLLIIVFGAILKIFKMEVYSNIVLITGLTLEVLAGILFFYYWITPKKRKS